MPDPTADRRPEAAEHKRVRTAWRLRHRYRLARRLATLAGTVLALVLAAIAAARLPDSAAALRRDFLVPSALLLAGATALPWLAVGALWRRA